MQGTTCLQVRTACIMYEEYNGIISLFHSTILCMLGNGCYMIRGSLGSEYNDCGVMKCDAV